MSKKSKLLSLVACLSILSVSSACTMKNNSSSTISSSISSSTPDTPDTPKSDEELFTFTLRENTTTGNYYEVNLKDPEENITNLVVPDEYNGLPVKSVNFTSQGYKDLYTTAVPIPNEHIKSLYIGKNVNSLSVSGFSALEKVEISKENTTYWVENNCVLTNESNKSYTTIVLLYKGAIIPTTGSYLINFSAARCSSLEEIYIPSSVYSISSVAFVANRKLKSFKSDNSKYIVRENCLIDASNSSQHMLIAATNEATIPSYAALKVIARQVFAGLNIKKIVIPSNITKFDGDYDWEKGSGTVHYTFAASDLEEVVIAEDSKIEYFTNQFQCTNIKTISIPDNVKYLGNAFQKCKQLESVKLPRYLKKFDGSSTFYNCTSLSKLTMPANPYGFRVDNDNTLINTITNTILLAVGDDYVVPNTTNIYSYAFGLIRKTLTFADEYTLTSIPKIASLNLDELHISSPNLKTIAFEDCNIKKVYLDYNVDSNNGLNSNCFKRSNIGELHVSEKVKSLRNSNETNETTAAFYKTTIGDVIFDGTNNTGMVIVDDVLLVGQNKQNLHKVLNKDIDFDNFKFPSTLLNVCSFAFYGTKFKKLDLSNCDSSTFTLYDCSLFGLENLEELILPTSLSDICTSVFGTNTLSNYNSKDIMTKNIKKISIKDSENCLKYKSENGNIISRSDNTLILGTADFNIPEGVTTIASNAFNRFAFTNPNIVIPEGVTTVADGAFIYTDLQSIVFPSSCTSIGNYALRSAYNLQEIEILNGNCKLSPYAFGYTSSKLNLKIKMTKEAFLTSFPTTSSANNLFYSNFAYRTIQFIDDNGNYQDKVTISGLYK